jgi:hypothetical protein
MLTKMLRASAGINDIPSFISFASAFSGIGDAVTINAPSDNMSGDILVAVLVNDVGGTWNTASGFTEQVDNDVCIQTLITGSSEPSTYTFSCSGTDGNRQRGVIARFRNGTYNSIGSVDKTSPFAASGITMTNAGLLLGAIVIYSDASESVTLPTSMTTIYNSSASTVTIALGYEVVASGATGTRTFTTTDSTASAAVLLGLRS